MNTILKISESSVKKLENLIEKHVSQNTEILELYEKIYIFTKNDFKEDNTNEIFILGIIYAKISRF